MHTDPDCLDDLSSFTEVADIATISSSEMGLWKITLKLVMFINYTSDVTKKSIYYLCYMVRDHGIHNASLTQ